MKSVINLITKKDGQVVLNVRAKSNSTIDKIVDIAKCEVNGLYADVAYVYVDGNLYKEIHIEDTYDDEYDSD